MIKHSLKELTPILLFTYKRIDFLKETIKALQDNFLAKESELFIFSDGGKTQEDELQVKEVRQFLKSVTGFKNVTISEAKSNQGLSKSIISGVSTVIEKYGKVIVLEDDLVTSRNFLDYMNQALDKFSSNSKVFAVSGFSMPLKIAAKREVFFTMRASSWGWATWENRWNTIDWEVKSYSDFQNDSKKKSQFNKMGSDMAGMLEKQMTGKINSWAIRWCYHQFMNDLYSVHPNVSKVMNIGFGDNATHTKGKFDRFMTKLDTTGNMNFKFLEPVIIEPKIIQQFVKPYSIRTRIMHKILNFMSFN